MVITAELSTIPKYGSMSPPPSQCSTLQGSWISSCLSHPSIRCHCSIVVLPLPSTSQTITLKLAIQVQSFLCSHIPLEKKTTTGGHHCKTPYHTQVWEHVSSAPPPPPRFHTSRIMDKFLPLTLTLKMCSFWSEFMCQSPICSCWSHKTALPVWNWNPGNKVN